MSADLLKAHLLHHARYQLERHGRLAAFSLLVLLLALGFQLLWVDALHASNAALRQAVSAQQARARVAAPQDKAQNQSDFLATLPDTRQALEVIAVLNKAANRHQVSLAQADYRLVRQGSGPVRYQINLPLRADYGHLRAWLQEVMQALPNAALDDFSLKRDDVAQTQLEAHVRLSVFMRVP